MNSNVNNRIRDIRKIKRMSGTHVANMLGISSPYYYDLEKGKRKLNTEIATKLADIFGVTVDYLLGREKPEDNIDNEIEFIKKLDLDQDFLLKEFEFVLDGEPLTEEETNGLIAYLRASRQIKKK